MWGRFLRVWALFLLCFCTVTLGFSIFHERIPNGDKVRDPCDRNDMWKGVGHQTKLGGGPTNPFGQAFKQHNFIWTKELCMLDSDGDGATNGLELGDPLCIWKMNSNNPVFEPFGHPGICEPWSSPFCQQKNAKWLKCPTVPVDCEFIGLPGVQSMAMRLPHTPVPAQETTYMCVNLEFPSDKDYHVIADTAFLNNSKVLHHMTLQACSKGVNVNALAHPLGQAYPCEMLAEPVLCPELIAGWTPAIGGNCHPREAGYKIGLTGSRYAVLQVMWNNPLKALGEMDSSGILLFYTPRLRPFNIGMLTVGTNSIVIPPGERGFDIQGQCHSTCTRKQLINTITLLNGYNHMHYAGAEMRVSVKQGGNQEETVTRDIVYDYDNPVIHKLTSPVDVSPGDAIFTSCSYNTVARNMSTFYGNTPSDEMCLALFSYYPAEYLSPRQCLSEMGLPQCVLKDATTIVDSCQVVSFPSSPEVTAFVKSLKDHCVPFRCARTCLPVVKQIKTNPCLNGMVQDYIIQQIAKLHGLETITRLKSCDVEIAKEQGLCNKPIGQTNCFCSDPPIRRTI